MPKIDQMDNFVYQPFAGTRPEDPSFTVGDVLGAAFRQENDVVAATQLLTRPTFEPDPTFDIQSVLGESDLFLDHHESLSRAQSQPEFDAIEDQIRGELRDRNILMSSGGGGMAAAMFAGVLSPTMFVPLSFGAKGIKGVSQAFALAGAAAGVQEAVLFAEQETRTKEEFAFGVGAATVLGGLLGGAVAYMPRKAFNGVADDMAMSRGGETISYAAGEGSSMPRRARETSPPDIEAAPPKIDFDVPPVRGTFADVVRATKVVDNAGAPAIVYHGTSAEFTNFDPASVGRNLTDKSGFFFTNERSLAKSYADLAAATTEGGKRTILEAQLALTNPKIINVGADDPSIRWFEMSETEMPRVREEGFDGVIIRNDKGDEMYVATTPEQIRVVNKEQPAVKSPSKDFASDAVIESVDDIDPSVRQVWETEEAFTARGPKSIGAAETRYHPRADLKVANPVFNWVNEKLALLNPVTRTIQQKASDEASYWMGRLSDGGLRTKDNTKFIPHATEGTVEVRAASHEEATGTFIQEYDDAYARHVLGDLKSQDELQNAFGAYIRSGTNRLPEGKLNAQEFGDVVFNIGQTGQPHSDPTVMRAVKAQRKLFDYFKDVADEAYSRRVEIDGGDARRMFNPEGNLGPDIEHYIHHMYDTTQVTRYSEEFKQLLKDNAAENAQSSFQKSWQKWRKTDGKMGAEIEDAALDANGSKQLQAELKAEVEALDVDPEYAAYRDELTAARAARNEADEIDKPFLELQVQNLMDGRSERIRNIEKQRVLVNRRLKRDVTFRRQTKAQQAKVIKRLEDARAKAEDDFDVRARKNGATDLRMTTGEADFTQYSIDAAEDLYNSITGLDNRASGMDILGGARGPELSRVLNLPFEAKKKFLHSDPEHVARIYSRHMSADVELYRATGSVNGARMFDDVKEEFKNKLQQLEAARTHEVKGKTVAYTDKTKGDALDQLQKDKLQIESDLNVAVQRLRHQRGIPDNADGMGYRLGRAAMDMNVYRMMGTVVLSSAADVGRPVMKMGLMKTMKNGWSPFIRDMDKVKMTRANARRLGVGWDTVMHNRTQAVFDMWDDYASRKTRVERGMGFLANKTGFVAGFDRWTQEMKFITSGVAMSEASDSLRIVAEGGTAKQLANAQEFLAANGIDAKMADDIWKQFQSEGGSTKFDDGSYLPNMEAWKDYRSMAAYRAMIKKITDDTIVTPGLDRPAWMDANTGFKMLAQFRSFNFTATNRTVMAGLQEADMAVVNGMMVSLAMGAVSYYLWAVSVGGDALEEAMKLDAGHWADEAISRSGLLGIFAEPHESMKRIPAFQNYVTFGNQRTSSRRASSLMGTTLGPSYDLGERVSNLIMGLDEPTDSTLHQARLLWPYQNVFWLRKELFDRIEDNLGESLPERRGE